MSPSPYQSSLSIAEMARHQSLSVDCSQLVAGLFDLRFGADMADEL